MPLTNGTLILSSFILMGLPGMEATQFWLAFPLCAVYVVAVVGNCAVMFIVKTEPALHVPMYFFLCMLAAVDLALSTCTVPKILSFFWFGAREIGYEACLVQMFFIHSLSGVESTILLAMAVDRQERLRASGTCVAHVCVVLAFYVPLIGLSVVHRFGRALPLIVHVTMGNIYLLVPPVLNPLVYAARTKEIRRRALKPRRRA
ncbi:UNVERIFIED_CONTAM: hypothetical protein K2H54_073663 [Gekko kuhli]